MRHALHPITARAPMLLALALAACDGVDPASGPPADPATPGEAEDALALEAVRGDPATAVVVPDLPAFENPALESVPLFGGTMTAVPELAGVVAADPEGDRLVWVPQDGRAAALHLGANARPFRVEVEGTRAFVTLRGTGEVAAVDLPGGEVAWRTPVCPEPRGLDHGPDGRLVVACAGGELVAMDDATGEVDGWRLLDPDLRDVVAQDDLLYVSRFRFGEILLVDPHTLRQVRSASLGSGAGGAWRMRPDPRGEGVLVVHDRASNERIEAPSGGNTSSYGTAPTSTCTARHQAMLTHVGPHGVPQEPVKLLDVVLPVDFLVSDEGQVLVVNGGGGGRDARREGLVNVGALAGLRGGDCVTGREMAIGSGLPSAVAELDGALFAQTASTAVIGRASAWGGSFVTRWTDGQDQLRAKDPQILFHRDPGSGVACASCHPEGQDDGHVWRFAEGVEGVSVPGPRRTLPLAGRVLDRAPYHWMGELNGPAALAHSTYTIGMGGDELSDDTAQRLFRWIDGLRPVHKGTVASEETLALGEELFRSSGCTGCHTGEVLTMNEVLSVRPDSIMKTPTLLGLGMRTAYFHDGCARTLEERFRGSEECTGGDEHGVTSLLTDDEIDALVAYLETL